MFTFYVLVFSVELQVLQALDRHHGDQAMAFVSVLHSLVVSITKWYSDPSTGESPASAAWNSGSGESPSSLLETSAIITKPCQPSCEVIRTFLREYINENEHSERLMNLDGDNGMDEIGDDVKDTETGADEDDNDDDDTKMMCDDESKQEPPDHIKLVMEVRNVVVALGNELVNF